MLQAGILAGYCAEWLGADNVRRFAVQFREQVWPGDRLVCEASVSRAVEADGERCVDLDLRVTRVESGGVAITGSRDVRRAVRAQVLRAAGPIATRPLELEERAAPTPGPHTLRVRVHVCGCCRTDLHVCEGDLELPFLPVVPGHQVVGTVDAVGAECRPVRHR